MKAKVINEHESVIYGGKIYTYGMEFEVDETIGKSLIERGYIAGITDNPDLFPEDEVIDLTANVDGMPYKELQAYAKELGIPANGSKEELLARVKNFLGNVDELEVEEDEEFEELPNTSMPE